MPYYTRTYNPQPTARVTSQELKNEFQAIDNALDAAEADVGKGIRAPEATTALPNAASRALKVMSFDASGNPVATIAVADVSQAEELAAASAASASAAAASAVSANGSAVAAAASAASVGIPALAGNTGKSLSNDGTALIWQDAKPSVIQRTITGTDTLIASDQGKLINAAGTFTLAVTAAATLGNGWYCYVRNTSNGDVTIDPASTEQIDGATTYVLKPGFTVLLTCTGTAFGVMTLKQRTHNNISTHTDTGSFVVPADTYVVRGYAWGAGANGTTLQGGAGGGCAYGDIAVAPGETVSVTISGGVATVTTAGTARLTANNPAVPTEGGTATKHASVTNGGAYSGGNSVASFYGGGSASGSPLGVGGNSVGQSGGAAWGGFAGGSGGAGVGQAGETQTGGGSLRTPANLFTDPLLAPLTGSGGVSGTGGTYGAHGGPGGGGGYGAVGGNGGTGAGGGYANAGNAGHGGFGGGGGRSSSGTGGNGGLGGGGGGTGSTPGTGGAACVLIYY